ncbi:hypothetical protein MP228_005458 [Amoeboaphelidium protococcarum]|nr:hypothetical protein MP228_005458 [Amoeboaphelidium protococcarum]
MSSPLVWFLLLDGVTGEPYKGTSADYVSLQPGSVIAQFKDAVQLKYDLPNYLQDISSSTLLVYKNKAAFDKRNAAVDDGKEEPLEVDSLIDGLGQSKQEDMLVVVVPLPILRSQTQSSSFPLCGVPFFNSIDNANERDGWVQFGHTIPSTTLKDLFIRESYRTIASSIYPGINKAIITGTPGIGKSLFLIYLLWILARAGKRVLFIYHPYNIYYDGKGGVFYFAYRHLPLSIDRSFWNDTLWCLFDAKCKSVGDLNFLPHELCKFILVTSPLREMVKDFLKPPVPQVYYIPTWSEAELEDIAPYFPNANDVWRERFQILGGIPRRVLEVLTKSPRRTLEIACTYCSLDDCIQNISMDCTVRKNSETIYFLVHITSTAPYTSSSVCYASQTALDIIVRHKGIEAKRRMCCLIASCEWNPLTSALCGYIFEPYAIELLEKGGVFKCRELVDGFEGVRREETTLDIPSSIQTVVDKVMPNQTRNQLYVPKTKDCAAVDAWIPGIGAFQMTVGRKHEIEDGARDDLAMLGGASKLYWLLPPLYYRSFTKQPPLDIEQHAILIPYPE